MMFRAERTKKRGEKKGCLKGRQRPDLMGSAVPGEKIGLGPECARKLCDSVEQESAII